MIQSFLIEKETVRGENTFYQITLEGDLFNDPHGLLDQNVLLNGELYVVRDVLRYLNPDSSWGRSEFLAVPVEPRDML